MGTFVEVQNRNTYEKTKFAESGILAEAFDNLPKQLDNAVQALCNEIDQLKERVRDLEKR